jgi:phosphate transport system substrate-binding protein
MRSRTLRLRSARRLALTCSVGVVASLALTSTGIAAAPATGTACQAADGKISGRGATFQTKAQAALIAGYASDVCGPVADQYTGDPAGSNMITYNYPAAAAASATGSGAGQRAAGCRTDAFGGTDIPYFQATLTQLNGAPGTIGGCGITFTPPYTPAPTYPSANDTTANVMSVPVAGGAVTIGVNLVSTATCATPPTSLQFSTAAMTKLFGGDISNWSDPVLVADNPGLSSCNKPIVRVVRQDKSGTTQTFKDYLKNADGPRTGATCDPANTWTVLDADAQNVNWPQGAGCSTLSRPATSGAGPLVSLVGTTDGAVGYADLGDWSSSTAALAGLRDAGNTQFVAPNTGTGANCAFAGALMPGSTNNDAVGLNGAGRNWAVDASPSRADVTFKGTGYPICGFTWDFVYTGLSSTATQNPIAGLTPNQRRTLYSYFTYVFSPAAQTRLTAAGYAPLPASFLTKLRQGFQANF